MKKIIAAVLAIALLLGCTAFAEEPAAETAKTDFGTITINGAFTLKGNVPDGYKVLHYNAQADEVTVVFGQDDLTKPVLTLRVAFDETYSDVERMNDLDDEQMAVLEATYYEVDPTVEISYAETAYGTRVLVAKQFNREFDYVDFMSVYKGYFVEFAVTAGPAAPDRNLPEDMEETCINFLSELDFVPAGEEAAQGPVLAGKTYEAVINSYDEENNTINVTLDEVAAIPAEEAEKLAEGDTIQIGSETVQVKSIAKPDDGEIEINDLYILTKNDDRYTISESDYPCYVTVGTVDAPLTDSTVFEDGVDPETYEMLDEPVKHTAAEFIATFTAHDDNDVGFASHNVNITFDAEGKVETISRYYTPCQ